MRRSGVGRYFDWEPLEDRRCPSIAGLAAQDPAVPIERTDAHEQEIHSAAVATAESGRAPVVFLGDSITEWWGTILGARSWESRLAPLGAADFGVSGDLTQNLLWRVNHGELAGAPRVAVVLIGTNNLHVGGTVDDTARGIEAIVDAIHAESPTTKVLLLGILPRGATADDPLRAEAAAVNERISRLDNGTTVRYLDPGAAFVGPDGTLPTSLFPDSLHPNADGYALLTDMIVGPLERMLARDEPEAPTRAPATEANDFGAPTQGAMAGQVAGLGVPIPNPGPEAGTIIAPIQAVQIKKKT